MLSVEDWAEIRRLRRSEQLSISEVARVMGVARNTVKAALASDRPPKYVREPAGSVVDEVEPRIRELLNAFPRMPATVIAERIGWQYSIRTLSERVRQLLAGSGRATIPARSHHGTLPYMHPVCVYAGRGLIGCGGPVGRWRARELPRHGVGTVAAKVVICKPADPEAKGLVERFHDYLERSFLPGRVFASPSDFNAQLDDWLVGANHRQHRVLGCRPADRIEGARSAPVEPTRRHAITTCA
ncbi:hypothetical protein MAGR_62440 [Mycolicibacterium agri]|uniref:Integrase catalytic domain-containing protein n=1 Tax=Mycolicibacterium agri TaxID=36811 RepID=A0A7I9WAS1_MYCAG|nr:hypothetical protein MAGR_62440 [Mycolicibacterium agri]